jgi:hypothetical protein
MLYWQEERFARQHRDAVGAGRSAKGARQRNESPAGRASQAGSSVLHRAENDLRVLLTAS